MIPAGGLELGTEKRGLHNERAENARNHRFDTFAARPENAKTVIPARGLGLGTGTEKRGLHNGRAENGGIHRFDTFAA